MKIAIIQARSGSTRLPNKVLMEVNQKPLLLYLIERVRMSKQIDNIVIATTTAEQDNFIADLCEKSSLPCYRGSEEDVLSRYYEAACSVINGMSNPVIVRITGDCPLIDPSVVDEVISAFEASECDYCSNTLTPTYPDGMDTEVFSFAALGKAFREAKRKPDREHVTYYMYNSPEFRCLNYSFPADFSHLRLTVDEPRDFELIQTILKELHPTNPAFSWLDVVSFLTKNPELLTLNSHITRNEGLTKSLREEEAGG